MAKKISNKPGQGGRMPLPKATWTLLQGIRADRLYKNNVQRRDKDARKYIEKDTVNIKSTKQSMLPGQVVMFDYFTPKTEAQLEYYDAKPCTIFFGVMQTKQGQRVIGFNLHYYPPRMRFRIMDRIYDIFKPIYRKSWNAPLKTGISYFDYKMLIFQLQKAKLDFGIREYIPQLMASITAIPPRDYQKAVFTEGRFKKRTRDAILNYWKQWATPGSTKAKAKGASKATMKKIKKSQKSAGTP